jgi:hypothetical protein
MQSATALTPVTVDSDSGTRGSSFEVLARGAKFDWGERIEQKFF